MIAFTCVHCGKSLKVKQSLAGKKGPCPQCKSMVQIPAEPDRNPTEMPTVAPGSSAGEDSKYETTISGGADSRPGSELTEFLAPPQAPDELGRLGPYRVLKVLGAGGMGVVYRAEDPQLKRPVALKALLPALDASVVARKRFLREAQMAAAIDHDHIVHIYQVGEDRGVPFLAMQFLEGEALEERLNREKILPLAESLRIAREMAWGLGAAHDKGLIHRDIKPPNIWLEGKRARVKLLDFGIARSAEDDSKLTQTGAIIGTPAYMSPEQARGEKVDTRCDLFSLGCVLYRMTTGKLPFQGNDTVSTLVAVATEDPPPPQEINSSVPRPLAELIMNLLAKQPGNRPASAHAVAESIQKLEAGGLAPKGKSGAWGLAAVVLLLFLAGLGVGGFFFKDAVFPPEKTDPTPGTPDPVVPVAKEGSWQPLFDGRTLDGWTVHKGDINNWGVEKDLLFTRGKDRGWLMTEKEYGDFELRLEYRMTKKTNSGVAVRSPAEGDPAFTGMEIQIIDEASYPKLKPDDITGSLFGVVPSLQPQVRAATFWNRMHITVRGRRLTVDLNDSCVLVADLDRYESQSKRFPGLLRNKGRIGLQSHTSRIDFRDLYVRPLPPEKPAGKPSLYDGFQRESIPPALLAAAGTGDPYKTPAELVAVFRDEASKGKIGLSSMAASPDGHWLALGKKDSTVRLLDLTTRKETVLRSQITKGAKLMAFRNLVFSPDSQGVIGLGGGLRYWRRQQGAWKESTLNRYRTLKAAFSPNGMVVGTGHSFGDTFFRLTRLNPPGELPGLKGLTYPVSHIAFQPDGKAIVLGGGALKKGATDGGLKLWSLESRALVREFKDDKATGGGNPGSISWQPKGHLLASTHDGRSSVLLWDTRSGKVVLAIKAHTLKAHQAVFSPDGKTLASSSDDNTIRLFDPQTGQEKRRIFVKNACTSPTLKAPIGKALRLAWAPDGRHLLALLNDGTVFLLRVTTLADE
jgi:WD40 repeat protein